MKIVINTCFGGFGVSQAATVRYNELKQRPCYLFHQKDLKGPFVRILPGERPALGIFYAFDVNEIPLDRSDLWWKEHDASIDNHRYNSEIRSDPALVQVVEELGEFADGPYARLKVIEIPDGVEFEIDDYDGCETVREKHRSWS